MGHISVSDVRAESLLYIIFGLDVDGTCTQKAYILVIKDNDG